MAHYSIDVLDRSGNWSVLGRCVAYDRAERWFTVCTARWPEAPLRIIDQPAGVLMVLRDYGTVRATGE